jgi:putative transposase
MTFYRRNLPHWHPEGESIFLTWRLHGSLPADFFQSKAFAGVTEPGRRFRLADAALDGAATGPLWLKDPRVATCVLDAIRRGAGALGHYDLHAFVVMPNHIHLLITPKLDLARITNGLKGASARQANLLLQRTGQPFWQDESFDRWARDAVELERIRGYIERNPVSAGLAGRPEDWPWSSACRSS